MINSTLLGIAIVVLGISFYTSVEGKHAGAVISSFAQSRVLSWIYAIPVGVATFSYGYITERNAIERPDTEDKEEEQEDGGLFAFFKNTTDQLSVGSRTS